MISSKLIKFFIFLSGFQFLFALFGFLVLSQNDRVLHAVFGMAIGLYVFWIIIGGILMWKSRNVIRSFVLAVPISWKIKFVLFCTLLALIEEGIATAMTNLAPAFGVAVGEAYITLTGNYLDLVLGQTVIMFGPIFIAWAFLLGRYDFKPNQVFLLFGFTGVIIEMIFGGPQHILEAGMWILVYGLMVYLPAYCLPERSVKPLRFYHYALPFICAVIFQIVLVPVVPLIKHLRPSVLQTFPPMQEK